MSDSGLIQNVIEPDFHAAYPQYTFKYVGVSLTRERLYGQDLSDLEYIAAVISDPRGHAGDFEAGSSSIGVAGVSPEIQANGAA
ncbi:MAG: hypothetical protein ACLP8S_13810 [Solirubrobacteraceae bacterium]